MPLSYPTFQDYSSLKNVFADSAGWAIVEGQLQIDNKNADRIMFPIVTGNFFQVLGVKMHLGRSFHLKKCSNQAQPMLQYLDITSGKNVLTVIQMLWVQPFELTEPHSRSLASIKAVSW